MRLTWKTPTVNIIIFRCGMSDKRAKRIIEAVGRLLAERDILDPNLTVGEVVEKRFDCPTPEVRSKLTKAVHEFRENGKVDWKRKIEE